MTSTSKSGSEMELHKCIFKPQLKFSMANVFRDIVLVMKSLANA